MMINQNKDGSKLCLSLDGRLDTATAPDLEAIIDSSIEGITMLTIDMENLEYVSSAGLRVILKAQKIMNGQGEMKLRNVNETIMEVFDITGFIDILTIE
ncbi:MAG: STAS domain-containing protein [Bacillota bacterium]|nr:STAS domain-containing protein [Bacillota bacterium]